MPAKSREDLQKKTLNLRQGDWSYLDSIYESQGIPTSYIVRNLVSQFVDGIKSKEREAKTDGVQLDD